MRTTVLLLMIISASAAHGQTTICIGDECTTTRDGKEYKLTKEEVATMRRADARTAIQTIPCQFADDPDTCRIVQKSLFEMFPF